MNKCIFQERFKYEPCRSCDGYDLTCPNRLEEFKYSKPIVTQTPSQLEGEMGSIPIRADNSARPSVGKYSSKEKPFSWFNSRDRILEPLLPRPDFLKRFRRSQR